MPNMICLAGMPGVGKTTLAKAFAQVLGLDWKRIQFTPDLLPADVLGTLIYNPKDAEFKIKKEQKRLNVSALWGERRGSNPRHSEPQSDALPTELQSPSVNFY